MRLPYLQFWSVTLSDTVTRAPLQTPQGAAGGRPLRCALGATMAEQRPQLWTDEGCIVLMPFRRCTRKSASLNGTVVSYTEVKCTRRSTRTAARPAAPNGSIPIPSSRPSSSASTSSGPRTQLDAKHRQNTHPARSSTR